MLCNVIGSLTGSRILANIFLVYIETSKTMADRFGELNETKIQLVYFYFKMVYKGACVHNKTVIPLTLVVHS